jgi:glyoxalase family protein
MTQSPSLHHITALSGDIRRTHDFYARVLGLRLVKRTVNYDDPASWHLYYGDAVGTPGTIVSFFSWEDTRQAQPGAGEAVTIAFAIPPGAAAFWAERFADEGVTFALDHGAATPVIALHDPDGIGLELVEEPVRGDSHPAASEVPFDMAITGLSGATLLVDDLDSTARVLMDVLGWVESGRAELPGFERVRFTQPGSTSQGARIELLRGQSIPPARRGAGSIHHIAFRARDDADQAEMAAMLRKTGMETTPQLDRTYFRSVYFREPSGVLFEIATDAPGFAVDESVETMGAKVMLPEKMKADRAKILAKLPEF